MSSNRPGRLTPSQRIAEDLRTEIRTGALEEGERLPSTAQLMERYGVAYQTARQAIAALKAEGLIDSRAGSGVFVRRRPPLIRLGSARYSRRLRERGQAPLQAEAETAGLDWRQEILELGITPAPSWVAEWFGIEPGAETFVRRRRTWVEGEPTQLADSYYLPEVVRGTLVTEENTGPGGSYARLEEAGHHIIHFREELEARQPTPEEAEEIQLPSGVPVIELHRIAFTTGGPLEVFRSVMAGNRHTFAYEFEAPE
ncbi:GntR family transcriptional regulator [Nocardioides sp. WG-D5]